MAYQIHVSTLVAGALTFTAALAWNEAAKTGIQSLYPQPTEGSFRATALYAIVVTILVVIVFTILQIATKTSAELRKELYVRSKSGWGAGGAKLCAR
jgi:hypothetical protein